jgi:hypothetical protein
MNVNVCLRNINWLYVHVYLKVRETLRYTNVSKIRVVEHERSLRVSWVFFWLFECFTTSWVTISHYHMTVRPHSHAPIKNHTEKSCDWVCTGLVERAVKSRPAPSKTVWTRSVTVCVCVFISHLFLFSTPLGFFFFFFKSLKESVFHLFCESVWNYLSGHTAYYWLS